MKRITKIVDTLGLGVILWLIGYIASIILFSFVPNSILGWVLFAVFTPVTFVIAYFRFRNRKQPLGYYFLVASVWVIIAIAFDYIFIVTLFNSSGYYKADVFAYYLSLFLIPILVGKIFGSKK